jgi:hypothetical protein
MSNGTAEKKREFTIRCTKSGGVDIEDGDGKKGGNLRTHGGKNITWTNSTSQAMCYLEFKQMLRDDAPGEEVRCWPFSQPDPGNSLLALPVGDPVKRTLKKPTSTLCIEYVVLDGERQPLLDPVIIIDPN